VAHPSVTAEHRDAPQQMARVMAAARVGEQAHVRATQSLAEAHRLSQARRLKMLRWDVPRAAKMGVISC
jgi:hypothetical protein